MARRSDITFAGVSITAVPPQFQKNLPHGRYNFFEVPWNISCPGSGILLVSSQQILEIEGNADHDNGNQLVLGVYDDVLNDYIADETTVLNGIYMIKATPVWGETFRNSFVLDAYDLAANTEGLWALEIMDKRALFFNMAAPKSVFNVTAGVQTSSGGGNPVPKFVEGTSTNETTAYTDAEIFAQLDIDTILNITGINTDSQQRDIFLTGVPVPIACDLLLHNSLKNKVFKFDPFVGTRMNAVSLDTDLSAMFSELMPFRLTGGSTKQYPTFETTASIILTKNKRSGKADYSDYFKEGHVVAFGYCRDTSYATPPTIPAYHAKFCYHALYRGFLNAVLVDEAPISLVRYSWAGAVPTTEVHVGQQSPIRTLLEGPTGHFLREVPLRVTIDGQIGLPLRTSMGFRGKIILCNHTAGWAIVQPDGTTTQADQVKVRLVPKTWHQGGDDVTVIPVDGDPGLEIMDHINGFKDDPPAGAIAVIGPARTACMDADPG